jgi:hypothetical protein
VLPELAWGVLCLSVLGGLKAQALLTEVLESNLLGWTHLGPCLGRALQRVHLETLAVGGVANVLSTISGLEVSLSANKSILREVSTALQYPLTVGNTVSNTHVVSTLG